MTRSRTLLLVGVLLALVLAGGVSFYASASPDGLEKVAQDKGFLASAKDHGTGNGPFADYATKGVDNERLSGGLAGVVGVLVTLGAGVVVFTAVRRRTASRG